MWSWYLYSNTYYMIGTVFVLLASLLAIYAQGKVSSNYSKYRKIMNHRMLTGAQVARDILNKNGLSNVEIRRVNGQLSDHYNPSDNTVNLSAEIYDGTSIAAVAVAAHECGHAIQHKEGYRAIVVRNIILPFANIGQYLGWVAIMIGLALGHTNIAWIGFILMLGILAFQLVTLPVEFNASSRALTILNQYYLDPDEYNGAKNMLSAAALTYVAAMISTLMSMLRIFLIIFGNSRDNRR